MTADDVLVVSVGTNDAAPEPLLAVNEFGEVLRGFLDEVTPARTMLLVPPGVDEARLPHDAERTRQGVTAYAERAAAIFGAADAPVLEACVLPALRAAIAAIA